MFISHLVVRRCAILYYFNWWLFKVSLSFIYVSQEQDLWQVQAILLRNWSLIHITCYYDITYHGNKCTSWMFEAYCCDHDIKRHLTVLYTTQQNGVATWHQTPFNGTLYSSAKWRCQMAQSLLLKYYALNFTNDKCLWNYQFL